MYDFDGDIISGLKTTSQLDLAMYASANFVDDFVLIDQFATSDKVLFDLRFVGSRWVRLVIIMTYDWGGQKGWERMTVGITMQKYQKE